MMKIHIMKNNAKSIFDKDLIRDIEISIEIFIREILVAL